MKLTSSQKQARHVEKQKANGNKLMKMYVPVELEAELKQMVRDKINEDLISG